MVIGPGTYREAVTLRGQVELVSADGAQVELVWTSGTTLEVFGSVRVTGITIAGPAVANMPTVELSEGTLMLDHVELRREADQASGGPEPMEVMSLALAKSRTSMDLPSNDRRHASPATRTSRHPTPDQLSELAVADLAEPS